MKPLFGLDWTRVPALRKGLAVQAVLAGRGERDAALIAADLSSVLKDEQPSIPLFDALAYSERYDVPVESAWSDYLWHAEERDPHPLFDTKFYLSKRRKAFLLSPLHDYLANGSSLGVSCHPLFDPEFYAEQVGQRAGMVHFIEHGAREKLSPHRLFDVPFYLKNNVDVGSAGYNPLRHFLAGGAREMRRPHPLFDIEYYLSLYDDVAKEGYNALVHFVTRGDRENRKPHPLFEPYFYRSQLPSDLAKKVNSLEHYLTHGDALGLDPHALFDTRAYRSANPEIPPGTAALVDFVTRGRNVGPLLPGDAFREAIDQLVHSGQEQTAAHLLLLCTPGDAFAAATHEAAVLPTRSMLSKLEDRGWLRDGPTIEQVPFPEYEFAIPAGRTLPSRTVPTPPHYVGAVPNALVIGGTRVVIVDGEIWVDELATVDDPAYGTKCANIAWRKDDRVVLRYKRQATPPIERGIYLCSEHDQNYYHWIVEVLPKLAYIDTLPIYGDWPLLVTGDVHPNLKRTLELVNIRNRRIVELPPGHARRVEKLLYVSDVSRILDRYEGAVLPGDCILSARWLGKVRELLLPEKKCEKPWRKLYLARRNAGYRRLRNEDEVEQRCLDLGFEIALLDGASFATQQTLFDQASVVVGPTGAAFTNLLLCRPGARALILASDHESMNFNIFSQLATLSGVNVRFGSGPCSAKLIGRYSMHDDFTMDIGALTNVLEELVDG